MLFQRISATWGSSHSVSRFIALHENHISKRTTNKFPVWTVKLAQAESRRLFRTPPSQNANGAIARSRQQVADHTRRNQQTALVEDRWAGKNGMLYRLHGLNENHLQDVVKLHHRIVEDIDPIYFYKRDPEYFLKYLKGNMLHADGGHMCGIYHKNELVAYSTLGRPQLDSNEMRALSRVVPVMSSSKDGNDSHLIATLNGSAVCKKHRGNGFQAILTDYRKEVAAYFGIHHFMSIVYNKNAASLSSLLKNSLQVCGIATEPANASEYNLILYNVLTTTPEVSLGTASMTVHSDEEIKIDLENIDGHRAALEQGLVGWKLATRSKKNGRRTCLVYSSQAALQAAQERESFMKEQAA